MTSACRSRGSTPVRPFGPVSQEFRGKITAFFVSLKGHLTPSCPLLTPNKKTTPFSRCRSYFWGYKSVPIDVFS